MDNQISLSVIVLVTGDILAVERPTYTLLGDLRELRTSGEGPIECVIVADGRRWEKVLSFAAETRPPFKYIVSETECELPGVLANVGVASARGKYMCFLWPGCRTENRAKNWSTLVNFAIRNRSSFCAGVRSPAENRRFSTQSWLPAAQDGIPSSFPLGWLQMLDLVPMSNSVIERKLLTDLGGFSSSLWLQRCFWWDFCLRAARMVSIRQVNVPASECRWGWHDYPFGSSSPLNSDLASRLMVHALRPRPFGESGSMNSDGTDIIRNEFPRETVARLERRLRSTSSIWYAEYCKHLTTRNLEANSSAAISLKQELLAAFTEANTMFSRPLRVTVVGGLDEPAHNAIYFFNYFQMIKDWGLVTWRTVLDTLCHPADLTNADVVIFTRVRSENGRRLMDFCNQHKVATIYMIDDNWFWVGREWPEYAGVFAPGLPAYENFLYCVRHADVVLTYSRPLAEDLGQHASRLHRLNIDVNLSLFPQEDCGRDRVAAVGYVGTHRRETAAFKAMAELARDRQDISLFVMSTALPEPLKQFEGSRLEYHPYVFDYDQYAKVVCRKGAHILIAPLGSTRTESSKSPTKYLEITAAGAVGVYSNVKPYADCIKDGENGILATNTVGSWKESIQRLLDSPELRRRILHNAKKDVAEMYSTERNLLPFLRVLKDALETRLDR